MPSRSFQLYREIQRTFQVMKCLALISLLLFSTLAGCAFKKVPTTPSTFRAESPKTGKIEPEARNLFFQAERQYQLKNYDGAARLYNQVKFKFPKGKAHALSSYRLGSIYYYLGDYPAASREFEYYLNRYPNSELNFDVAYNLAAAEYQLEHYDRAQNALARLKLSEVQAQGPKRAEIVYQLAAQTATALGNHSGAVAAFASQMQLPQSEAERRNIEENIDDSLAKISSVPELHRLQNEVTEPVTKSKISTRLAALDTKSSQPVATTTISEVSPTQTALGEESSGERTNVGVVLPLTGRFAIYGRKALEGILLAARVFSQNGGGLRLFIEDSVGNPLVAQNALDSLVTRSNVVAVIGPLNWKEALATAERAQELGVLNLSLSGKEGISERGAYLFQNALTPSVQLGTMVEHCIKEKGMRRFAIVAPRNSFGRDMANEFWEAVEKNGGRIVAHEEYPTEEKDFQAYIKNLTGVADPKHRKLEWVKLNEFLKEATAKGGRTPKAKLQPIVDFDAIFIPDSPKTVASIAASLAYFDVSGVPLLGTTEWNTEQLYKRGGKYVEGAIFPGGINLGTRNTTQREFIKLYYDAYGTAPDLLASQAYEAVQLVSTALQKSGSGNRNELVNQMMNLKEFESPLGILSFDQTRIAKRKLPIYTLEAGGVIVEQ